MISVGPKTPSINSPDKRFEIDGANAAQTFVKSHTETGQRGLERAATPTDLGLGCLSYDAFAGPPRPTDRQCRLVGITAGFDGPNRPGGIITVETTYDNFVGEFDKGHVDGYNEEWEKRRMDEYLAPAVKACEKYEN